MANEHATKSEVSFPSLILIFDQIELKLTDIHFLCNFDSLSGPATIGNR